MTKTITQCFANITALKHQITAARQEAREQAERECGRGLLVSRGAYIRTWDAAGNIINGEAESWEFKGTAAQFRELADILRDDDKVAEITIEGGWNWAVNTTAYNDCDYDPWVSEWCVSFGTGERLDDNQLRGTPGGSAPWGDHSRSQD